MNYPEHEKLKKVMDQSQVQGEFLEWLQGKYVLTKYDEKQDYFFPVSFSIPELLAEYHEIDLNKIELEKREMIKELREMNS